MKSIHAPLSLEAVFLLLLLPLPQGGGSGGPVPDCQCEAVPAGGSAWTGKASSGTTEVEGEVTQAANGFCKAKICPPKDPLERARRWIFMGKLIKIDFTVECVDFPDDQGCIDVPMSRELMFDDSAVSLPLSTSASSAKTVPRSKSPSLIRFRRRLKKGLMP